MVVAVIVVVVVVVVVLAVEVVRVVVVVVVVHITGACLATRTLRPPPAVLGRLGPARTLGQVDGAQRKL